MSDQISSRLTEIYNKATHFLTMMTTVNEVNNDKTKVLFEFSFRSVSRVRFTELPNSMSKLIHNRCTSKLIIY